MYTITNLPIGACVIAAAAASAGASAFGSMIDTQSLLASGAHTYSNNTTGTVYSLTALQPAGSGVFGPFVRIQNSRTEQGYNSVDDAATLDDHPIGPGNYLLPLNSGIISPDFNLNLLLDANEPGGSKSTLTLTDLMLVVSTNPNKSGASSNTASPQYPVPLDPGDLILYDMKTTTDLTSGNPFQILIDANNRLGTGNGGSGQADLEVSLDASALNGLIDANHFLYVYSSFANSDGGFEEWSVSQLSNGLTGNDLPGVPEPASLALLILGAAGLMLRRSRPAR